MIQAALFRLSVFLLVLGCAVNAETIGPFTSTSSAGIAPQCHTPLLHQRFPAAAFGKSVFLAVWAEGERSTIQNGSDIYCARIDSATGISLDPAGIKICGAAYNQSHPSIAYDGTNFLVVWEDFRNGRNYSVYGARVTEAGQVLDEDGFLISGISDSNAVRPRVAFGNGNYFVVWNDARRYPVYGVWGTRVSTQGVVLDLRGIEIASEADTKIVSKVPGDGRQTYANLTQAAWWDNLRANYSVSISGTESGCRIAWIVQDSGYMHPRNLMLAEIDAATGTFIRVPRKIPQAGPGVLDVSAQCATPTGLALGVLVLCPGFSSIPTFFGQRLDTALTPLDAIQYNGQACISPQPRCFLFDLDAGSANNVRGQTSLQKISAAYNGKNIVYAMEAYWYKTSNEMLSKAIILMRSALTAGDTLLDLKAPVRVDETTQALGTTENGTVSWPYVATGPNQIVLLLYEKNFGLDNRQVVARVLKEND